MKKEKLLIILLIAAVLVLLGAFIFYGSKIISFLGNESNNNQSKKNQGDPGMILVQLNDAQNELSRMQELATNQEQAAKIEILSGKIIGYQEEFKKPAKEITDQQIEDFYNAGLWQSIIDLKKEIGDNGEESKELPALE